MDNNLLITNRIIKARKKWMRLNLLLSTLLLLLIEGFGIDSIPELYLVYSIWQLFVFGYLVFSELRYPGLNILVIFFFGALMTVVYPSFEYAVSMINGEEIYLDFDYNKISDFVFRTSVSMNIYYSMFILLLTKFVRERLFIIDIQYVAKRFNLFLISIIIYLITIVLRIVPFLELISATLAQLAGNLPMLVLLLLAVYCGSRAQQDKYYKLFVTLLIVEIFYSMFFGYYKAGVARPAAMYIVYYYLNCRTLGNKILTTRSVVYVSLYLVFVLYIVYPFMGIKRAEANFTAHNDKTALLKVDNIDILKRVLTGDYQKKEEDDDETGNAFTDRMSSVSANAFFYKDAYSHGFHSDMIIFSIKQMIPGIVWKNKPSGKPGMMAKNYIAMKSLDRDAVSSAYVGLFASSYFWGGWFAVILMCFINAWILGLLLSVCFSNLDNLFSWLVIFIVVFLLLRCFEEMTDGGYSQCVLFLVYAGIIKVTSFLFRKKKITKV